MHVVLVEPEIPQNTGNIARTCVMTNSTLHLIGKLGFSLDDRYLRRAGLDYWPYLTYFHYNDLDSLYKFYGDKNFYYFTTRGERTYGEISYQSDDFLVFGKETAGLPQKIVDACKDSCMRIPMAEGIPRSLNLSNSVALVLYEALRQQGFPNMK
jgi:tRNA (cytidine/uridine-2'-O-)-methyltransferase